MRKKKYDITFIPIPTELYKDSELDYLLVKILEKRQKYPIFHWKSGNFLHFKLGKVEKTINPKASRQHSLRPIYMIMFLEKTIIAPTYYKVDLSGIG